MLHTLVSLVDLWIGRRAAPQPPALADVAGLAPCVVVTGASRGIGLALASRFANAGRNVAMVARTAGALDQAAASVPRANGPRVFTIPLDVTDADAPARLDAALREAGFYTDVLVNNAGMGLSGSFATDDAERLAHLLALNITAATRLMRHALPPMIGRGRGGILNVSSLGGLVPGPHQAAYYASKAYLVSLTEAVAHEERGRGVRIATVAPGPVDTGFHRAMQADNALYRRIVPALSPEFVAASAYRGFMMGRRVIVPGLLPTVAALAVKILPHAVTVPLVAALLAPGATADKQR
ncbi:SDR family NAD(P)-dependent oxidoreductase [Hyphomicrobium sp.]|uniref:SDR family NAD(P)-dependent oxidoreductase n=1 Tax=Hyphomicrobium sp. TaxID=82 RepID=UPI003F72C49F